MAGLEVKSENLAERGLLLQSCIHCQKQVGKQSWEMMGMCFCFVKNEKNQGAGRGWKIFHALWIGASFAWTLLELKSEVIWPANMLPTSLERIRTQTQAFQQGLWASQAVCQPLCQMFAPKAGFRNRVSRGISFYNSVLRAFLTSESKKASKGQILTSLLYSLDQSSPTKTLYWCWGPSAIMLTLDSELQLPESTKSVEKANHNLTGKPGVIFLSF